MKVEISDGATADLERIGDWIAQENPVRAESFVEDLEAECMNLAYFPERYPVYKNIDVGQLRRKAYGNYLIFYVIDEKLVNIARILHGAQDYSDLF